MAPRRVYIPDLSVHVIQRGNNRGRIFDEDVDYEVFLAILRSAAARFEVFIHVYALMTTHYHLIATPGHANALPRTMKAVGTRYVRYFNRKYSRVGTLWSGRYRALPIYDEQYWLTCLRYVEHNPVRAGMVESAGGYRWSSFGVHGLGYESDWLEPHHVYQSLGSSPEERQIAYRAICARPMTAQQLVEQRLGAPQPREKPQLNPATDSERV